MKNQNTDQDEKEWGNHASGHFINCKPGPHHTQTPHYYPEPFIERLLENMKCGIVILAAIVLGVMVTYLALTLYPLSWHFVLKLGIFSVACLVAVFVLDEIIHQTR